jgi:hypothetical protein
MRSVVDYRRRDRDSGTAIGEAGGGGGMDDTLTRISNLEAAVSDIRTRVAVISAIIPTLATKEDLKNAISPMKEDLAALKAQVPHFATKTDVMGVETKLVTMIAAVETKIVAMEAKIIKWIIATMLATAAVGFSIAKLVH